MNDTQAFPSAPTADALSGLYRRLEERHGFAVLNDEAAFDAFAAGEGDRLVLFAEDPAKFPETWDVAVVLPEVVKPLAGRISAAVLSIEAARRVATRYGIKLWPALVFLRGGEYVDVLEGMKNWDTFAREVPAMLTKPVSRAPSIGIAVNSIGGSACA